MNQMFSYTYGSCALTRDHETHHITSSDPDLGLDPILVKRKG